jgi:autotransporter translocation and assembly factor TamB
MPLSEPDTQGTTPRPRRRWLRRAGFGVVVLVSLLAALVLLLQLPPVATRVVRKLLTLAPLNPGNRLEVGRVSGNFFGGLTLEDVSFRQAGRELAHIPRLRVAYHLPGLLAAVKRIDDVELDGARITARRQRGRWDLVDVMRKSSDTTGGGGFALGRLQVRDAGVAAALSPDSIARVRGFDLAARDLHLGDTALASIESLSFAVQPPGSRRWLAVETRGGLTAEEIRLDPLSIHTELSQLSGRAIVPRSFGETRSVDRLDVRLAARPLDLADLASLAPAVPGKGKLQFDVRATGDGDLVTAHLGATLDQATVNIDGGTRLERGAPKSYRMHGVIRQLDPARLHASAPTGSINADLDAKLDGPLAQANGDATLRLDRSRIGTTTVRRFDLSAVLARGAADLRLRGMLDTGAVTATGRARPFDSIPTYRFSGSATGFPGTAAVARALAGPAGEPALAVAFRFTGQGKSADSARVQARVDLTAVRDKGARVPIGHTTLRLADGRLMLWPELLAGGGRITAVGSVTLGDTMSYRLRDGRIDRVDLGKLTGDTLVAPLNGRFSLEGRGTAPAEAQATARIHFDRVRVGKRRVERVDAVARLDRGQLRLQGDGALQGGRLVLEALGRPFDSTSSYVLRRAALEGVDLGTFLGQPAFAGPVTLSVTGQGRWRGEDRSAKAQLTVQQSRLGHVEVAGGGANLELAGKRVNYDASLQTNAGALSLAGDGTPMADVPLYRILRGELTAIDLGTLLDRSDLHTDLNTSFTAQVAGSSPDSLHATLGVVLLPSKVNQAELSSGSLQARVEGRNVQGKLQATGQDAALQADLNGERAADRTVLKLGGTIRVEHLARWTGRRDADGRIESRFALHAETDSAGLRSADGNVDGVGGIGEVRVPVFHLALSPAEGQLLVDTIQVRSNAGSFDGGGRVALRQGAAPGTLKLVGQLGDLGPVAALAGADTVAFDSARVNLAVTGPAWHWLANGGADAYGLAFGGNLANRVTLKGTVTLDSTRMSAVAGDLRVQDAAYGKLTLRQLTVVGRYDSTLAVDLGLNIGDSVKLATQLRGTVSTARDTIRAQLQRLNLDEGGRAWTLERPVNLVLGSRVEVNNLALRAEGRSITLNGIFDRRDSSNMTLRIAGLDLETLRASGLAPVGGVVDGYLRLLGRAAAPQVQGKMALTIVSKGGRRLGTVGTDVDWTRDNLRIAAAATPAHGGALTVNGTLPYRLTLAPKDTASSVGVEQSQADTVALAVKADSFDLALFQPLLPPETARRLHGFLRANAKVGGTIKAPEATGTVNLSRGAVELPTIRIAYERGELDGQLQGDSLLISRLNLFTGKKEQLTATGAVRLRPLNEPGLNLQASLQHFRLVNSTQLQTAASGKIQLGGTLLKPSLSGNLQLDRTSFFVGAQAAQSKVEQVDLKPEELRDLARDFGPSVLKKGKETPGLMQRVKLDLGVQMPNQVWIRRTTNPKMNIELAGKIRVTQEPGKDMQFSGHLEPVPGRGTLDLSGREFRLTEGDINLAGPVDSTKLDVNASYQAPTQGGGNDEGVLIDVHAKGRLDSLGLEFSSDPSMSQDDIMSYIVTGRPASDNPLFERQGGAAGGGAGGIAMGTLASAISSAAGSGLGFDVFQIRQDPSRGLTLTAGRYLGSRLFLDMELPLQVGGGAQQATSSNLGPGFELEYTLRRWLRANVRGGSLSPGLVFRARRAY